MKTIPLIGYADPLSARPGETINFKISCALKGNYNARLNKLICTDPNPAGPGIIQQPVESELQGSYPSVEQIFNPGSHGRIDYTHCNLYGTSFSLATNIWPTLRSENFQTVISLGFSSGDCLSLGINTQGQITLGHRKDGDFIEVLKILHATKLHDWSRIWLTKDNDEVSIGIKTSRNELISNNITGLIINDACQFDLVSVAADATEKTTRHYNGKIELPILSDQPLNQDALLIDDLRQIPHLLSCWDFSQEITTTKIIDIGPAQANGRLINLPTRAMMGSNWDSNERNWCHAPEQYGAIHFHEDDIYDFQWQTNFSYTIPKSLKSGIYSVTVECRQYSDNIPFFVCAEKARPQSKLCVLVSTFTYVIYGNHARPDFEDKWLDHFASRQGYPWNPAQYPNYGLSTYNIHKDGSGIGHADHRRPLLNMKSGYITFGNTDCSGLRHFQADSHLIAWLEHKGFDYDLITDQQLQDEGINCIAAYSTLMTGSHPEYHTGKMLDALTQYRDNGGHFIYLGGNGFYWKIAEHSESIGTLEVRRAEGGIRAWAAEPGEYYHSFDGQYGGLWRRNNRPPQALVGIGFSGQGKFTGSFYERSDASFDNPEVNWIFENIEERIIGDFGLCGHGAAGFELDRVDHSLGSADNVIILASSQCHDTDFVLVPEEQLTHITTTTGDKKEDLIRADMIYQINDSGAQLFSTGSITFCGSLMHNNAENNISQLLQNVVKRFTA